MTEYAYRDVTKLGPYREDPVRHYGLAVDISREFTCLHLERSDLEQEALTALCAAAVGLQKYWRQRTGCTANEGTERAKRGTCHRTKTTTSKRFSKLW